MVNAKKRFFLAMSVISLLSAFSVSALTSGWQWIAPQRVTSLVKEGSGLWLVDVRNEAAFGDGHIEGAVNLPAALLATKRLPQGKIIVLVDDSLGLRKGREAAEVLLKRGHDRIFLLEGGMPAWQGEGYPVAGKGGGRMFRGVMPDDIAWARENRIPVRIFDLRDKAEQAQGPIQQAQAVEGKNLVERLKKVREMVTGGEKKGMAAKLEKPATIILVFPTAAEPRPALELAFREFSGDIRFLEGGYAAWAAKPDKAVTTVGTCPTCPGVLSGGKK